MFSACWAIVKVWLDEKTRQKISLVRSSYTTSELLKFIDEDQLPTWLGGKNQAALKDNAGPWNDYELVDGGEVVGVRKISDGPDGKIFTPEDH